VFSVRSTNLQLFGPTHAKLAIFCLKCESDEQSTLGFSHTKEEIWSPIELVTVKKYSEWGHSGQSQTVATVSTANGDTAKEATRSNRVQVSIHK
jgi:hypothetical protein